MLQKTVKKLWIWFILAIFPFYWYAELVLLEVNKSEVNQNENIYLKITLNGNGNYKWIQWVNDFKIISTSESISMKTQTQIIGGERKDISHTQKQIFLTLSPEKIWQFQIGPAIFETEAEKFSSNTILITVQSWNILEYNDENIDKNYNFLWYILGFIILAKVLWIYVYYNKPKKNENNFSPIIEKQNFSLPNIDEADFERKLYKFFLSFLSSKYDIKNTYSQTLTEIIQENPNLKNISKIQEINLLFQKIKYSPEKWNKKELLEIVESFIKSQ